MDENPTVSSPPFISKESSWIRFISSFAFICILDIALIPIPYFFLAPAEATFQGQSHWNLDHLQQCEAPRNNYYRRPDLGCYTFRLKDSYETIRMELLSRDPLLIVFRRLADNSQIRKFLEEVRKKELKEQVVHNDDATVEISMTRRANGTWFSHEETPGMATMYHRVKRVLPNVNVDSSEDWSVLSYFPGGHYAVHYDMFTFPNKTSWDDLMRNLGNRWATFLVVLKTAEAGGGTVFPNIETTVIPEAGDAMFWTNMNTDKTKSLDSQHGACLIKQGQKIAATLWIHEKNQPLLTEKDLFDPKFIIQPTQPTESPSSIQRHSWSPVPSPPNALPNSKYSTNSAKRNHFKENKSNLSLFPCLPTFQNNLHLLLSPQTIIPRFPAISCVRL